VTAPKAWSVLSEDRFTAQLGVEIGILLEFAAGTLLMV
jgi:hypothetical protein